MLEFLQYKRDVQNTRGYHVFCIGLIKEIVFVELFLQIQINIFFGIHEKTQYDEMIIVHTAEKNKIYKNFKT